MSQFTPGPWTVKPPAWRRGGPPYKTAIVADTGTIANVLTHAPRIRFEGDVMAGTLREIPIPPSANAVLISAAPDLLEALTQMRREWGAFGKLSQGTLNQADAAIAKAGTA